MVPEGFYKVALAIDLGTSIMDADYHWYRQVSDLNGAWVHKLGDDPAKTTDDNGNPIYSPSEAARGGYTVFVGYFALTPPSLANVQSINDSLQQNNTDSNEGIPLSAK